jgi:hypothetical protein
MSRSQLLIATCLFVLLVSNTYSQSKYQSPESAAAYGSVNQCRARAGEDACFGFTLVQDAAIFSEPKIESRILSRIPAGINPLFLSNSIESVEFPGWVSVVFLANNQYVKGWMRHLDIVLTSDLRRVVDCWPIEAINWDEDEGGDYAGGKFRLKFDRTGKILPKVVDGRVIDFDTKNFAIYYARGVFRIRPHTHLSILEYGPVFVLDNSSKKLTFLAKNPSSRFFPEEKLEGCKDIPKLDLDVPMKFKQDRK